MRWRRALAWLGALALIPSVVAVAMAGDVDRAFGGRGADRGRRRGCGSSPGRSRSSLPFALAWFVRGREAAWMLAALGLGAGARAGVARTDAGELALYALLEVGAVGVVLWGLRDGQRLAVNVGVLGFALADARVLLREPL